MKSIPWFIYCIAFVGILFSVRSAYLYDRRVQMPSNYIPLPENHWSDGEYIWRKNEEDKSVSKLDFHTREELDRFYPLSSEARPLSSDGEYIRVFDLNYTYFDKYHINGTWIERSLLKVATSEDDPQ